jgi:serine/threonine-protein kinase
MGAPVEIGEVLAGKYRVDKILGEGGMGVVVAATDTQLERQVAIKFLLPQFSAHAEAAPRFMREARAAVKIQSEHIARVIDVNTMPNGSPYMVMEMLHGADLANVLSDQGPLAMQEAVLYVIEACDAIAEAHSHGIVHRDLKPANLFLAQMPDGTNRIKVLDFGISKSTIAGGTAVDQSLTRTSSMMGSPLYMSPEQMKSTRDVDARTDIWALGVILYELLTGTLPFSGQSIPELSAKILLEPPTPLHVHRPDLPAELEQIVMRALEKGLDARYPSASEFAIDLVKFGPRKARTNVERITKLLGQAGISKSMLPEPPSRSPAAMTAVSIPQRKGESTVAEFGATKDPHKTTGRWSPKTMTVGAAGIALLVAGVLFAVLGRNDPIAEQPASAESPVPAAAPPAPPRAQVAPEPVDPTPAAAPVVRPVPDEAPSAAATAEPPKPAARPTTRPKTPQPAPAVSAEPAPAASSGGFKSKYGGRK